MFSKESPQKMKINSVEDTIEFYHLEFENLINYAKINGKERVNGNEEKIKHLINNYDLKFSTHQDYTKSIPSLVKYFTGVK